MLCNSPHLKTVTEFGWNSTSGSLTWEGKEREGGRGKRGREKR